MDGWIDGWIDRWMDGWMDGWMDRWMNPPPFPPPSQETGPLHTLLRNRRGSHCSPSRSSLMLSSNSWRCMVHGAWCILHGALCMMHDACCMNAEMGKWMDEPQQTFIEENVSSRPQQTHQLQKFLSEK